jgi:hypothetical protein
MVFRGLFIEPGLSLPDHPLLILLALEEQIRPLLLKGDKLLHAQEEADHVRITLEHFFLEFVPISIEDSPQRAQRISWRSSSDFVVCVQPNSLLG